MELADVNDVMERLTDVVGEMAKYSTSPKYIFPNIFTVTTGRWTQPIPINDQGLLSLNYQDNRYPTNANNGTVTLASWDISLDGGGIALEIKIADLKTAKVKDNIILAYRNETELSLVKGGLLSSKQIEHINSVLQKLLSLLMPFVQE